jgi:ATP-dependent RNA helicase RhlE
VFHVQVSSSSPNVILSVGVFYVSEHKEFMSFSNNGQSGRSYGNRGFSNNRGGSRGGFNRFQSRGQNRGPQPTYINPSRYVNKAVEKEDIEQVEIKNTFEDFQVHTQLMKNIRSHNYVTPTVIQDQAIPAILQGRDVVGIANTGTGKTAAFLIPLINKVAENLDEGVLIVVPTRELAVQIAEEFQMLAAGMRIGMILCVGGVSSEPQIRALRNNPHFVIGTPGRLKDLANRHFLDTSMFTNIVLDEVDRMLDIGFVHDIRFLISQLPTERSSYFFSATMNRETEDIMRSFLKDPVRVSVRTRETSEHIHQDVVKIHPGQNKIDVLHELLLQAEFERVIVFGRTKHGIDKLEKVLREKGVRVTAIHGNKSQNARQRSLQEFKRGRFKALLATDVAARGIDIDDVSHVINFDEPNSYEDYIHRIGRTGRAGKTGKALTFVT